MVVLLSFFSLEEQTGWTMNFGVAGLVPTSFITYLGLRSKAEWEERLEFQLFFPAIYM